MTAMSLELLAQLKASLNDVHAAWVMQSAMVNQRIEQTISVDGLGAVSTTSTTVNNDSYRIASAPLNLMLVFLSEYTPDAVRSISVTFQGVALTTTDQALLTKLKTLASSIASAQDLALQAALVLPT